MKLNLSKDIYRFPFSANDTHDLSVMYPKKHEIILVKQKRLNNYFKDKRRINHVELHTNPQNETFLFGRYGSRKDSIMVTIGYVLGKQWIKLVKEG